MFVGVEGTEKVGGKVVTIRRLLLAAFPDGRRYPNIGKV